MVTTHTVLGKAAAIAMLPALTLGIFAVPASADYTEVQVINQNAGYTMTEVASLSNSGGNVIMSSARSAGGNSGSSRDVAATSIATTDNDADVDEVEAESGNGDADATGAALADGDAHVHTSATSRTGDGGSAGRAETVNTIRTGDAVSDVLVMGGTDHNEVDIEISDDCACDRANEYHEKSMHFLGVDESSEYDNYYHKVEDDRKEEAKDGRYHTWEKETEYSEEEASEKGEHDFSMVEESEWEVHEKTYVPVKTVIAVANVNETLEAVSVLSGADTGNNAILAESESVGGTSGESKGVYAGSAAHTSNDASVEDVDAEARAGHTYKRGYDHAEGGDATADGYADAAGNAHAHTETSSETGNGGDSDDTTSDNMILSGRSDSIVTVVKTSRHNVVRIVR